SPGGSAIGSSVNLYREATWDFSAADAPGSRATEERATIRATASRAGTSRRPRRMVVGDTAAPSGLELGLDPLPDGRGARDARFHFRQIHYGPVGDVGGFLRGPVTEHLRGQHAVRGDQVGQHALLEREHAALGDLDAVLPGLLHELGEAVLAHPTG